MVDVQAGAGISAGLMVYKGVPIVFGYTRGSSVARINREKKITSVPKKDLDWVAGPDPKGVPDQRLMVCC